MMNNTKVDDLTVDELKNFIRETVTQTLVELLSDPDEELFLREKLSSQLLATFKEPKAHYKTAQTIAEDLNLNW